MPPPSRARSVSNSKKVKGAEENKCEDEGVENTSPANTPKSKHKKQTEVAESQPPIDKLLKPIGSTLTENARPEIDSTLKNFSEKLDKLASQEYIEKKFREMITEEMLSKKLKNLESVMKEQIKKEFEHVYKKVTELKERVEETEKTINSMRNEAADMETKLDQVECENKKMKQEAKELREQLKEREFKLRKQEEDFNNLEQYTRNSVRIYGVEDRNQKEAQTKTAQKIVKLLGDKLQIKVTMADIDIAHRMGRFKRDANRPIICKFVSRFTKYEVIKAQRNLKIKLSFILIFISRN